MNGSFSDTTWTVTNTATRPARLPSGWRSIDLFPGGLQEPAHRAQDLPDAAVLGCDLLKQPQTVLLANIPNPRFVTASELANPDIENPDIENLTIALRRRDGAHHVARLRSRSHRHRHVQRGGKREPVGGRAGRQHPRGDRASLSRRGRRAHLQRPGAWRHRRRRLHDDADNRGPGTWSVAGGTCPRVDRRPDDRRVHRHADHAGHLHFHRALRVDNGLTDYRR